MPVHVRVGLLTAEGQGVDALGRHCGRDGPRDPVDDALGGEELRFADENPPPGVDMTRPTVARVYDYWLGGCFP
jgi:hypothetical protein